jgi:hypothetical protein
MRRWDLREPTRANGYPEGSKLAPATWTPRSDERYLGAEISDQVKSLEFVFVFVEVSNGGHPSHSASGMEAKPLKKESDSQASTSNERSAYLLSQRAALMP